MALFSLSSQPVTSCLLASRKCCVDRLRPLGCSIAAVFLVCELGISPEPKQNLGTPLNRSCRYAGAAPAMRRAVLRAKRDLKHQFVLDLARRPHETSPLPKALVTP